MIHDALHKTNGDYWLGLLFTNISKHANIRSLLLSAYAFGCSKIFVCNQPKFNFDHDHPDSHVPKQLWPAMNSGRFQIQRFQSFDECVRYVHSLGAKLLGVEIDEKAIDVEEETCFTGSTVLIMGNESNGLSPRHSSLCDGLIRISQYGGGTASLNVYVAASIVMHRFQLWTRNNASKSI